MTDQLIDTLQLKEQTLQGLRQLDVVFVSDLMALDRQSMYKAPALQKNSGEACVQEILALQEKIQEDPESSNQLKRSSAVRRERVPGRKYLKLGHVACPSMLESSGQVSALFESKQGLIGFDLSLKETGLNKYARDPLEKAGLWSTAEVFNMNYDEFLRLNMRLSARKSVLEYFATHTIIEASFIPADEIKEQLKNRMVDLLFPVVSSDTAKERNSQYCVAEQQTLIGQVDRNYIDPPADSDSSLLNPVLSEPASAADLAVDQSISLLTGLAGSAHGGIPVSVSERIPGQPVMKESLDSIFYVNNIQDYQARWTAAIITAADQWVQSAGDQAESLLEMREDQLKDRLLKDENILGLMENLMKESFITPFAECSVQDFPWLHSLFDYPFQQKLLKQWMDAGLLQEDPFVPGLLQYIQPSLDSWISSLPEREQILVNARLEGLRLDEAGERAGIGGEGARQALSWVMKQKPVLEEERYAPWLAQYRFYPEDAAIVFDMPKAAWQLIEMEQGPGKRPLSTLLDSSSVPVWLLKRVRKALKANYLEADHVYFRLERRSLLEACARLICPDAQMDIYEFYEAYLRFLRHYHLEERKALRYATPEVFQKKIRDADFLLFSYGLLMRWYPVLKQDAAFLVLNLHLEDYADLEISTLLLYRKHPDLMKQYGFLDEYELHSFLLKTRDTWKEAAGVDVIMSRSPHMEIGQVDVRHQIEQIVEQLPIFSMTMEQIAQVYEYRYGAKTATFMGTRYHELAESVTVEKLDRLLEMIRKRKAELAAASDKT